MPLNERDYVRGAHPPACTCVACSERRLARLRAGSPMSRLVKAVLRVFHRR